MVLGAEGGFPMMFGRGRLLRLIKTRETVHGLRVTAHQQNGTAVVGAMVETAWGAMDVEASRQPVKHTTITAI
jgi:hypothetical protein